jgi:hypothetical protein
MAAPVALAVSVDSLGSGDALYTLNEPIISTFMRDLRRVGKKLKTVLVPLGAEADTLKELRDWDLWGPLLLCLVLSIITSARAPSGQHSLVFAGVFVLVWVGAAVVTLNAKLLGGKMCVRLSWARCQALSWVALGWLWVPAPSHTPPLHPSHPIGCSSFFQSVCVLGYCVCPLVIAAVLGLFLSSAVWKVPIVIGAFFWSCRGAWGLRAGPRAAPSPLSTRSHLRPALLTPLLSRPPHTRALAPRPLS